MGYRTRLSVNINKVATLRNSRGNNIPNVLQVAKDCERFGAEGITVHPRPDERHIRYQDVFDLKQILTTEFNIEGNPQRGKYLDVVLAVKPTQATLVPDADKQLTSDHGWDTKKNLKYLQEVIAELKQQGIRTSIFVNADLEMIEYAAQTGTDRIELYTEPYASGYLRNREEAIFPYIQAAKRAHELGLGVNAGHDLNLVNLAYFKRNVPYLLEVSIGHALIADALYYGLENTIQLYKRQLD
ncbi:MAG: pyridoxine 5'-phosphate synthase [Cytophagales bacterium]|nr:pyridoxine 5'-phosphate synthase [Cytophagales bacterium]MDW8385104.1 pyridoxine 5'-phosphate synthase [Flammeovirgaceae bacterium]